MKQPLVSAIVPVYNTTEYVEECILSILSQSYENIELILVNDGSTDGAGDICRKYEHLENVIYIENVHQGVVEARKHGVEVAHGEWIMFVDSDDLIIGDAVQQLMQFSSGVDIVVGRYEGDTYLLKAPDYYSWDEYLFRLYSNTGISSSLWAKLFKKELFVNNPQAFTYRLPRSEDFLMNLVIATANRKNVAICKSAVYYYRLRFDSAIHTHKCNMDFCLKLCDMADNIVDSHLPTKEMKIGSIKRRMYYYHKILIDNNNQGNKHHPFVKGIIKRMNQAMIIRLSDRLILSVSNRKAVRFCMILSKFIRRFENPSLIIKDFKK